MTAQQRKKRWDKSHAKASKKPEAIQTLKIMCDNELCQLLSGRQETIV